MEGLNGVDVRLRWREAGTHGIHRDMAGAEGTPGVDALALFLGGLGVILDGLGVIAEFRLGKHNAVLHGDSSRCL
jgi:hypothetical protein